MPEHQVDLTRWAVVRRGPLTASGRDEIVVRTVTKAEAQQILGLRTGGARRLGLAVVRVQED